MSRTCPTREQLERMLTDSLPGDEADDIGRHVTDCRVCQHVLETLTDADGRTADRPAVTDAATPDAGFRDRLTGEAPTWRAAEPPTATAASSPQAAALAAPPWPSIPGYKVLDELGSGGMGIVYKAYQIGANRLVALKMIRSAAADRHEDALRLIIEGETLARMQHPNIVRVYEVGASDGRPFFSLEYVDGGTLHDVIGGRPQPPRDAAEMVETLARAVHAAHQYGVVHRDLKPANILMARGDTAVDGEATPEPGDGLAGAGTPKVADFGLAKPVGGGSGLTHTGQILGTPNYMAPEQAIGESNVGIPADVYALGAILYELLTGRPPFRAATAWDTLMQVVHDPPPPPSRWRKGLPRDLETICLKCLEKDPARRYPSADAMGDDLRRWLDGEPVRVRPAGAARRAWMWCRRRPAQASLAALLAAAVIAGVAGVFVQWRRAEANLAEASARLSLAMDAIEGYYTGVSKDVLLKQPALADLRRSLLRQPLAFYRRLRADLESRRGDPTARAQLARAIQSLARLTADVGTADDAMAAYQEMIDVGDRLAREFPDAPEYTRLAVWGRIELGQIHAAAERFDQARALLALALADAQRLEREHPGNPDDRHHEASCDHFLGDIDCDTGRLTESETDYLRGLAIREQLVRDHPENELYLDNLGGTRNNLAILYIRSGQLDRAGRAFAEALADRRRLDERFPGVADYRRKVSSCLNNLGAFANDRGRRAEARSYLEQALAIQEELTRSQPTVALFRSDVAASYHNLGRFHRDSGDDNAARDAFGRSAAINERLVAEHPTVVSYQLSLCDDLLEIAEVEEEEHRWDRAEAIWLRIATLRGRLAVEHAANPTHRVLEAAARVHLADIARETGRTREAAAAVERALADLERLARENPALPVASAELAAAMEARALIQIDDGRAASAEADLRSALAIVVRLAGGEAGAVKDRLAVARCQRLLGDVARRSDRPVAAIEWYDRSMASAESILGAEPDFPDAAKIRTAARLGRSRALAAAGRLPAALFPDDPFAP